MNNEKIKALIKQYHNNDIYLSDDEIDGLLGICPSKSERKFDFSVLSDLFADEQLTYEGTSYNFIRHFLNKTSPKKNDVIYDFGSGLGRVILYGALVNPAKFVGLEIVGERVFQAEQTRERLKLENASFHLCNAKDFCFDDGNIFFLFNPFSDLTLREMGEKIRKIGKQKHIKIVTWGGPSNAYFSSQEWLTESPSESHYRMQFFRSV